MGSNSQCIFCWQWVTFDLSKCNKSLTITSEAFAATGWRVGWLIGPPHIIQPTLAASRRIIYSSNSPLQEAVARSLDLAKGNNFFKAQRREYEERRNALLHSFDVLGLRYTIPAGTYFALLVCG